MGIVKTYQCRICGSKNIIKNGKRNSGQQKYYCKDCKTFRSLELNPKYNAEKREEIIRAYQERSSQRGIQRIFGVSRPTLSNWIKKSLKINPY